MPVTYEIDQERELIRTRCEGPVKFTEVLEHFRALENDPSLPARPDVLLDLTAAEASPESDQLRSVAREVEILKKKIDWGACAIVADRDIWFGFARVFHAFAQEHFSQATVLRDLDEALRWLESQRSGTG